jgi:major membrane immunogen (membrane-anchored lipoprotein)
MKIAQLIIISFIFVGCSKNEFDIIIANGTIVDGSGQGSYRS